MYRPVPFVFEKKDIVFFCVDVYTYPPHINPFQFRTERASRLPKLSNIMAGSILGVNIQMWLTV
jgi:hypothetical protein